VFVEWFFASNTEIPDFQTMFSSIAINLSKLKRRLTIVLGLRLRVSEGKNRETLFKKK